jgi:hypothetical protein
MRGQKEENKNICYGFCYFLRPTIHNMIWLEDVVYAKIHLSFGETCFLERIASLAEEELVSDVVVHTFNFTPLDLTCLLLFPNLLAIRLTSKTDIYMLIQTKSVKSQWMGLTFGFMNRCHLTGSGILIKSMALLSGTKWAFVLKLDGLFGLMVHFQQELGQMLTSLIIASFTFLMLESTMQQMVAIQMDIDLLVLPMD